MYKLKIKLDMGEDFKVINPFIPNDSDEIILVDEKRNSLIDRLLIFYNNLHFKASDESSNAYIIDFILNFKDYILTLVKKYKTFVITYKEGNIYFEISLVEYSIKDYWVQAINKIVHSKRCINFKPDLDLCIDENFDIKSFINKINKLKDI